MVTVDAKLRQDQFVEVQLTLVRRVVTSSSEIAKFGQVSLFCCERRPLPFVQDFGLTSASMLGSESVLLSL